jgi:hypothetical protein
MLWPPDHRLVAISIDGVIDPNGGVPVVTVTAVAQDEPVIGVGDGGACPDATLDDGRLSLRAERSGTGNGRVYSVMFSATNGRGGSCQGTVQVCVPHSRNATCVDDGASFNSLVCQ